MLKRKRYDEAEGCPVAATLDLIDGKWKGVILYHLLPGPKRFNQIKRELTTITQRTLTKQLRELEEAGLISRTIFPQVPPRVDYALTAEGRSLAPVIESLKAWGEARIVRNAEAAAQLRSPARAAALPPG
ncbi:MAG: transcriptional regulator [Methylobacterium sp.]|nr:MAG: transcriptional regulator [Methylobacterium sp.]